MGVDLFTKGIRMKSLDWYFGAGPHELVAFPTPGLTYYINPGKKKIFKAFYYVDKINIIAESDNLQEIISLAENHAWNNVWEDLIHEDIKEYLK